MTSSLEPLELTILMPCLNEAETIERCVKKAVEWLEKNQVSGEVLIADNGSTDGSQSLAERSGARVIAVKEKGYGSALRGGIEAARGRFIIMGDADDSYDFSNLDSFINQLREGADLVMGCRMPSGGGTIILGAMPWKHRWIGNPVLSFIGRLFFKCPLHDFHCGLRGFRKEAILGIELHTTGMEFASEMVIKATLQGLNLAEVPVTLYKDGRSRAPHLRSWRDGWRHLRFMLLFSPRWLFVWPGLACFILGAVGFFTLLPGPIFINQIRLDTNTLLVASTLMTIGLQILFFGIFTRVFCETSDLLPPHQILKKLGNHIHMEHGILLGLILILWGLGFLGASLLKWKSLGFGMMSYPDSLRLVILSATLATLGVQIIFFSFFLNILGLKHR